MRPAAHASYARYLTRHRWYVFLAACRLGVPLRGLLHDWSKFLPSEWLAYADFFYGALDPDDVAGRQLRFDRAWLAHQHRNDHHWQHWILRNDDGSVVVLEMSDGARREMLADWIGAGRALGKPDTAGWYAANRDNILLGPETLRWVEHELAEMQPAAVRS